MWKLGSHQWSTSADDRLTVATGSYHVRHLEITHSLSVWKFDIISLDEFNKENLWRQPNVQVQEQKK